MEPLNKSVKEAGKSHNRVTMSRFIIDELLKSGNYCDDIFQLFIHFQTAVKGLSTLLRKSHILSPGSIRLKNDELRNLNTQANDLFLHHLYNSHATTFIAYRDAHSSVEVDEEKRGKYFVCFEALDNANNIECHAPVGSIISVYRSTCSGRPHLDEMLQMGRNMVAAAYVLYSSATLCVLCLGGGVHIFTLDHALGEFILTHRDLTIPAKGHNYTINEGLLYHWNTAVADFVEMKKTYKVGKPYTATFVDSPVADVHRILICGGLYLSPALHPTHPEGMLSLVYECCPLGFIATHAGGIVSDGATCLLDVQPRSLHQKSPLFLGSRDDLNELMQGANEIFTGGYVSHTG